MKKFEIQIQEKENYCVCSVLQAIFKKYSVIISQKEIALNLTPSKNGFYTDDLKIKYFLLKNNFDYNYFAYNQTPFNEPDTLLEEMNECNKEGLVGINKHVYLFSEFKYPLLKLIDPYDAKNIETSLKSILKEMERIKGFFGLLKYISN